MAKFVDFLEARKAETQNPKHAAMIGLLIEHTVAEVRDLDIDRTMATLVDDCIYHHWGDRQMLELLGSPRDADRQAVRASYLANMENGLLSMDNIELDVEHFFVSDDAIAWDGYIRMRLPGAMLAEAGMSLPDGTTAEDDFVMTVRAVIVIPFRDGLMVGEDFYYDGRPTLEKLA
ncbi:hypothetical protein GCM10010306_060780 [Streptomyces umbrinus]|nr:hypothetical protein GCM10010306_060780 [Streptomyces umbrinus]